MNLPFDILHLFLCLATACFSLCGSRMMVASIECKIEWMDEEEPMPAFIEGFSILRYAVGTVFLVAGLIMAVFTLAL